MDLTFLPKRLVTFCNGLVERHHHQHGYSDIARFIWHNDTMGFISIHEDLFTLLRFATSSWKFQLICLGLTAVTLILAFFISWWIALGVIPTLLAARYFARRSNNFYIFDFRFDAVTRDEWK
jgi:hypothetical protein